MRRRRDFEPHISTHSLLAVRFPSSRVCLCCMDILSREQEETQAMKTSRILATPDAQKRQQSIRYYHRILGENPSYSEQMRMYMLSWYYDALARIGSPAEAFQEVMDTLEFMQRREGEYHR